MTQWGFAWREEPYFKASATSSGGLVIVAQVLYGSELANRHLSPGDYLVAVNSTHQVEWVGDLAPQIPYQNSWFDAAEATDGAIVAVAHGSLLHDGIGVETHPSGTGFVARFSASGTLIWWQGFTAAQGIGPDLASGTVVAGPSGTMAVRVDSGGTTTLSFASATGPGLEATGPAVVVYDADGTILWGASTPGARDLVVDSGGELTVFGSENGSDTWYVERRAAVDGTKLWHHAYRTGNLPWAITTDGASGVAVAARIQDGLADPFGVVQSSAPPNVLVHFGQTGAIDWASALRLSGLPLAVVHATGGYVAVDDVYWTGGIMPPASYDCLVTAAGPAGEWLWTRYIRYSTGVMMVEGNRVAIIHQAAYGTIVYELGPIGSEP
jgi:hypothetical protein